MARLPVTIVMSPCPCLSPCQPPSRGAVTLPKRTMSLSSGARGIADGPSWKFVVVPPAGGNQRSRMTPQGRWMRRKRTGGPFAAATSSGRRKIEARPALIPRARRVRRRIGRESLVVIGVALALLKGAVAHHERGRGCNGAEQGPERFVLCELVPHTLPRTRIVGRHIPSHADVR